MTKRTIRDMAKDAVRTALKYGCLVPSSICELCGCASNNLRGRVPLRSRGRVLATAGRPRAGPEPWQIKKRDFIGGDGPFFGSSSGGGQGGGIGGRRARSQYRRRRIDARGAYRTRWPCDHRSTGTYACKMGATTSAPGLPRHDANQRVLDHVGNPIFTISREWPSATNASTAPAFQAARSAARFPVRAHAAIMRKE